MKSNLSVVEYEKGHPLYRGIWFISGSTGEASERVSMYPIYRGKGALEDAVATSQREIMARIR
jgi:hypothetical protein